MKDFMLNFFSTKNPTLIYGLLSWENILIKKHSFAGFEDVYNVRDCLYYIKMLFKMKLYNVSM